MKWTGLNDLREQYLAFFESKGHTRLPSASLIPHGDPSLLLINSGMAPLKKFFLGLETPPNVRVTTCQKCIRTPDIENVGKTARHGTYFEMLGNFSFGDYFKKEATAWAWEFVTKVIGLPENLVWISIYEEDDEAFDIWTKEVGIPADHIVRMGKEDNFWEHGSGPCGPCSELYFDRGVEHGCGKPDCAVGCECDRFIEFWNLVFTQFDSDGKGNYARMAKPNIDTGMGLERLACILQGVDNLFEVDTVQNIMKHIGEIAHVTYKKDANTDISLRVITDHIRSTTFMVGDGVLPANEGRGYVLRRLLRRAARHGRLLGIKEPFLFKVCETVIRENESAYPELAAKSDYIRKVIRIEEENFARTIDNGLSLLSDILAEEGKTSLTGAEAFKLYDTFGFPIDLTREIAAERGISLDEEGFHKLMQEQRERARSARSSAAMESWGDATASALVGVTTSFVGYDKLAAESKVLMLLGASGPVDAVNEGDEAIVVLEQTPFYAESGGQVGDTGFIGTGDGCVLSADTLFRVKDTKKAAAGQTIHIGVMERGMLLSGASVTAAVDIAQREATMRNHSGAHLLQAALREVLGDHVHQAGQLVSPDRLRFDFSHFSAMTEEELARVEAIVNAKILEGNPVSATEMPIADAQAKGAMALFGEKYGDVVRVVDMGYSMELCGGTHLDNTAKAGLFKILSESSVAAGVRRIEAVTGTGVLSLLTDTKDALAKAAHAFKLSSPVELAEKAPALAQELKEKERTIASLEQKLAATRTDSLLGSAVSVGAFRVLTAKLDGTKSDALRVMGDELKGRADDLIAVLAGFDGGKGTFLCVCGKNAVAKGAHAGNIVKQLAALTGGKGGGRPDSAMAGIADASKADEALAALQDIVAAIG